MDLQAAHPAFTDLPAGKFIFMKEDMRMSTWSGMRKKLETEYLAQSLRGHIQYFVTRYPKSHDGEGRAAIRYDGKEILQGCFLNASLKADLHPQSDRQVKCTPVGWYNDDDALKLGIFDPYCFYSAFAEFDNQSIEASLQSDDLIVRIFAILDRRVGKRRLALMKENISNEPETFQRFYAIRANAEGLL